MWTEVCRVQSPKCEQTFSTNFDQGHKVHCSSGIQKGAYVSICLMEQCFLFTQGALFMSRLFGCFRCEWVRENTLSLSFFFVKEREGILYLFPSFSFTPETAGHDWSALSNTRYSGRPFGPMLEVCYICDAGCRPLFHYLTQNSKGVGAIILLLCLHLRLREQMILMLHLRLRQRNK